MVSQKREGSEVEMLRCSLEVCLSAKEFEVLAVGHDASTGDFEHFLERDSTIDSRPTAHTPS